MRITPQSSSFRSSAGRRGFSLIEIVAVMWGIGILTVLGVAIVVGAFKVHQATAAAYKRANQHETLVDQFREDVAQAVEAPASLDKWTAGPTCLILRNQQGEHIVYAEQNGAMERWRWPKPGAYSLHPGMLGTRMEFIRSGPEGRLVTLRLTPPPNAEGKRRDPLDISAALGGDVR